MREGSGRGAILNRLQDTSLEKLTSEQSLREDKDVEYGTTWRKTKALGGTVEGMFKGRGKWSWQQEWREQGEKRWRGC